MRDIGVFQRLLQQTTVSGAVVDSNEIAWSAVAKTAPPEALWSRMQHQNRCELPPLPPTAARLLIVDARRAAVAVARCYHAAASIPAQIPWRARCHGGSARGSCGWAQPAVLLRTRRRPVAVLRGPQDTTNRPSAAPRSPDPERIPTPSRPHRQNADRPLPTRRHDAATHRRPRALQRRGVRRAGGPGGLHGAARRRGVRGRRAGAGGLLRPAQLLRGPARVLRAPPRRRAQARPHLHDGVRRHPRAQRRHRVPGLPRRARAKFPDIPDGIYGFSKIPAAGVLQIFLLTGLIELAWWRVCGTRATTASASGA